jgi:hypothetical protein
MSIRAAGPAGAAAAVAAAAELMRQEEEEMTPYSDKDLAEGWEFKMVRASMAAFSKPERFRAILEEENKAGWVLVEKFDDYRIRLKRRAGTKVMEGDFADGYDPYRSWVGVNGEQRERIIRGVAAGMFFMVIMMIMLVIIGGH